MSRLTHVGGVLALFLLALLFSLQLTACSDEGLETALPPRPVKVISVRAPDVVYAAWLTGVIQPVQLTGLGFRVTGLVKTIEVEVGGEVGFHCCGGMSSDTRQGSIEPETL